MEIFDRKEFDEARRKLAEALLAMKDDDFYQVARALGLSSHSVRLCCSDEQPLSMKKDGGYCRNSCPSVGCREATSLIHRIYELRHGEERLYEARKAAAILKGIL